MDYTSAVKQCDVKLLHFCFLEFLKNLTVFSFFFYNIPLLFCDLRWCISAISCKKSRIVPWVIYLVNWFHFYIFVFFLVDKIPMLQKTTLTIRLPFVRCLIWGIVMNILMLLLAKFLVFFSAFFSFMSFFAHLLIRKDVRTSQYLCSIYRFFYSFFLIIFFVFFLTSLIHNIQNTYTRKILEVC